jgi:hypothetical protein
MCYLLVHVIWIVKRGGDMGMNKRRDTIPEHFNSAEEAGKFWDIHSATDYWDEMEEEEMEFDIQKRTFLVPVDARIYQLAKKQAEAKHSTVEQIINTLLDRELARTK